MHVGGILCGLAALASLATVAGAATIHVAPGGRDAWSGQLPTANAAGTDGPVASLQGARDAVRKLRAAGERGPVEVLFQAGVYPLTAPVRFGPEDSGTAAGPVTYTAAPGARAVISGGRAITGFRRGEGDLWVADVPAARSGEWIFHQLVVDGRQATRARTPNEGFHRVAGFLPEVTNPQQMLGDARACLGFQYAAGDLDPAEDLTEANVVLYHSWTNSVHWIDKVDAATRTVRFTNRSGRPVGYWDRQQRYHVENVRSALDQPGEWFLDRRAGQLLYLPRPGEDLTRAEVIAPVATQLLTIGGDPEAGLPVEHLTFRDLAFLHTDWQYPRTQSLDGQAATFLPGAIQCRGARNCTFENLELAHLGSYGLWLERGCKDNRVVRCHLHDLAGGGVRIGESGTQTGEALSERNTVDNCFIHHGGQVFNGACGVLVQRSSYNRITHNEISDLMYTGISVGWSWGFAETTAHDNLVEHNHVHHLGWGVMSDMGGIYTLGVSPGTRINHNIFHDVLCYSYGGWGLYTDEGSSNIELTNNIVWNTTDGGFHQHYGADNLVRNNILVDAAKVQVRRSREDKRCHFVFENNIVSYRQGELIGGPIKNKDFRYARNVYWSTGPDPVEPAGLSFADWQELGHDVDSVVADPLFVDPANHDYRLKPESPALKLGFQPIDPREVGLYGDPAWVALPKSLTRPVMAFPKPPEPQPVNQDFETVAVGERPPGAVVAGETDQALVRVTEETAASGKRSLKVTDAAGLAQSFNPHFYWKPGFRRGTVTVSFDLRVEAGAKLYHEWRDTSNPYRVGPSVAIAPDGTLSAAKQPLLKVPTGQWLHLEIVSPVGPGSGSMWTLTVTLPGAAPRKFEGLPRNPAMRALDWLGFVSEATDARVFYLDNLRADVKP